ncbi:hypothetical protein QQF64_016488 [Cirrhinus molitorella]|uniref:Uncharacterized protein n=1 Tax=Cirrhinus molitorella TaxID=172907 RepID=A0ABR3LR75_9TELE
MAFSPNFEAGNRAEDPRVAVVVAEWLRRWTRNPLGSPRAGSNPADYAVSRRPLRRSGWGLFFASPSTDCLRCGKGALRGLWKNREPDAAGPFNLRVRVQVRSGAP